MAELFGKATGCSKGKGGSMLDSFDVAAGNLGGHGIVGGQLPLGLGTAFAQQYKKTGGVTFCFMGDGAINQGHSTNRSIWRGCTKFRAFTLSRTTAWRWGRRFPRFVRRKIWLSRGAAYGMPHTAG